MNASSDSALPRRERLVELVGAWDGRRVLLIGDVASDVYLQGRASRISREAPVLIVRQTGEFAVPGQAGNAAVNLASLGARVDLITIAGDDGEAERLRGLLEERGVDCSGWTTVAGRRTATKTRVLAGSHHTRLQQVVRVDRDENDPAPRAAHEELLRHIEQRLADAEIVVVSDYGYHALEGDLWHELRRLTSDAGIEIVLDSRHRFREFQGADLITPNELEGMALAGRSPDDDPPDAPLLAGECLSASGARAALLKRGNHGMCLAEGPAGGSPKGDANRRYCEFGVYGAAEAVDPSGAGDTVVAAAALARVVGATWCEAAHLANIAAGITTQRMGAASATAEELLAALADWPERLRGA